MRGAHKKGKKKREQENCGITLGACSIKQDYTRLHLQWFSFCGHNGQNGVYGRIPNARLPRTGGTVGTYRQDRGKFRRDLIIIRYVTHAGATVLLPLGEVESARVSPDTGKFTSAGELRFVNQFCASTIKARTSMLHLLVLAPFANRIVDLCVNRGVIL